MAKFEEHCEDTLKRLGGEFREIHTWLDECHRYFGGKHRCVRHHKEGVEEVRALFGDEGATAAECHIRLDCLGRIPSREDYETGKVDWLGHGESAYRVVDKRSGF